HEPDAQIHADEFLHRLDCGDLNRYVERRLKPAKGFNYLLARRRLRVVTDEGFTPEVFDVYATAARESMFRRNDKHQLISHDQTALEVRVFGNEREYCEVEISLPK